MDFLKDSLQYVLHLDKHFYTLVCQYGVYTYVIICTILFCETGLVITPILPGDSLLFAAGLVTAGTVSPDYQCDNPYTLKIWILLPAMILAVLAGDNLNYLIGRNLGVKLFEMKSLRRILKRKYLTRTESFYEKYGKQTIILARYVPIVRTFAPFVAGLGKMRYRIYIVYCVIGGVSWVSMVTLAGYFFGNIEFVKKNMHYFLLGIIVISFIPPVFEYFRIKRKEKNLLAKK